MANLGYSRYRQYYQQIGPALKKPHIRAYTMTILSLFTLSFFGAFAIRPAVKEIFELNRKINDQRLVNQKLDEKIGKLQLAEQEYEKIQADLPLILGALPQEPNFPPFLKAVEGVASSSAISLNELRFQDIDILGKTQEKLATPSAIMSSPRSIVFTVNASGFYLDLLSSLKNLLTGSRLVVINESNFSVDEKATTSATLRMDLKGTAYFYQNKIGELE